MSLRAKSIEAVMHQQARNTRLPHQPNREACKEWHCSMVCFPILIYRREASIETAGKVASGNKICRIGIRTSLWGLTPVWARLAAIMWACLIALDT